MKKRRQLVKRRLGWRRLGQRRRDLACQSEEAWAKSPKQPKDFSTAMLDDELRALSRGVGGIKMFSFATALRSLVRQMRRHPSVGERTKRTRAILHVADYM